ncbi:DNA polymerase III subunit gamma/tau [Metallumcola ferriviriculae]|uniref:DNA-directed DNA polymerase n=1 Tax=Metallumcola ferriviriculae TaxID=3039180 RepID=A0AAU0UHN7_9FIRM|nr:DNA polymerase III subunit gamma/tau [Desulfitibacteraceae bacterium MK1]
MDYKALYRQWRPQSFSDVVGQEHITKTLTNAIISNRIAHAYLFCGPRGTGKTSTAKIIGKSVNCTERNAAEPCNSCQSCVRINNGSSMDVQEIDAASNRGIEEIRDLREKVKYAPSEGTYKVYIIDEVHMLTTEAFNALLKTLEEPPAHVIFILATTEPHKIPATILSRCQRFDFRRIGSTAIEGRLLQVVDSLDIKIEEKALTLLAKAANGGLRDALSTLDQCTSYAVNKITVKEVTDVLGTVTQDVVVEITQLILDKNVTSLLQLLGKILDEGKDPQILLQDLLEHLRNILLVQVCKDPALLIALPDEIIDRIRKQSQGLHRVYLDFAIDILTNAENSMKWSGNPRLMLELAMLKVVNFRPDLNIEILSDRIAALENKSTLAPGVPSTHRKVTDAEPNQTSSVSSKGIKDQWQKIIKAVKKVNISTYAFLVEAEVLDLKQGVLTLGYSPEYSFHRERLGQKEHRSLVEEMLKTIFGQNIRVECQMKENVKNDAQEDVLKKAQQIFGHDKIEEENN